MANRQFTLALTLTILLATISQAQSHEHQPSPSMQIPARAAGNSMTLQALEQLALENNPTLRQASAEVRTAEGRKQQAGLWPNPIVGYSGEQIRGGSFRGGEQGFFVEQRFLLGGKLGAASRVAGHERSQAQAEADEQRLRVLNGVRILFYRTLAAQKLADIRRELSKLSMEAVDTTKRLHNVGQADETDVLQAEIEAQQADMALITAQNLQQREWTSLAATIGKSELKITELSGSLDADLPDLESEPWLETLLRESPAVKIADFEVQRTGALVEQSRKNAIPDLLVRGGLQQNRELSEFSNRPVGIQGFAEIGVSLPIFNRNQGNTQAAQAQRERAENEVKRVELVLRDRTAPLWQSYRSSRALVDRYRFEVLPRAQKSYELFQKRYEQMAAAYPQVLVAHRTWLQLQSDYVSTLENVWTSAIGLRGFLLTDGLEAPGRPGEMDRSVRDINLPKPVEGR